MWKRQVATGLTLAIVGWQAAVAVLELASGPSWPAVGTTDADRIANALGANHAIYRAIERHVPAGSIVAIGSGGDRDFEARAVAQRLRNLLFPRLLLPDTRVGALAAAGKLDPEDELFALHLGSGPAPFPPDQARPLERGERFALFVQRRPGK